AYVRMTQDQHVAVPEAIQRTFGMPPEALEKAIAGYLRSGEVTYFRGPAPAGIDNVTFTSHPLNDLEIKTVLADLDYHSRDYRQRGIKELEEILSRQPENVVANRGLGYEALQQSDWEKASEHFKRAAANDVKDPRVHYLLAMMLNRRSTSTGD